MRVFSSRLTRRSVVRRSANDGSSLREYHGRFGKLDELMSRLVEPHHDQTIEHQRKRRGPLDGLGQTIGRVLQSEKLFAVFEGAFNRPAVGVCCQDLPCAPIQLGAVEHLIGAFPFQVAHQDDRQLAVSACLVVESLDGFDGERGMQPELVEFEPSPGLGWILGPLRPCQADGPLSFEALPCSPPS